MSVWSVDTVTSGLVSISTLPSNNGTLKNLLGLREMTDEMPMEAERLMLNRIGQDCFCKIMDLLDKLHISVCFRLDLKSKGAFDPRDDYRMIYINPRKADATTFLHEVGHVLLHPMCCNEHDEYAVYGVVLALAAMLDIEVSGDEYQYALSFSTVETCSVAELKASYLK